MTESLINELRRLEDDFFDSLSPQIRQRFADEGMDLNNMRMFGEIGFFVLGLKPAVLFDNFKPSLGDLFSVYSNRVLNGTILDKVHMKSLDSSLSVAVLRFERNATETCDLDGMHLIYNENHPTCSGIFKSPANGNQLDRINDELLASLLDYPIHISGSLLSAPIAEVGYKDKRSGALLTSFIVPASWVEGATAHQTLARHFKRYQLATKDIFDLEIIVSMPG